MKRLSPEDIAILSETASVRAGLNLRVYMVDREVRAELFQQLPGGDYRGRLVWQHHNTAPDDATRAVLRCADALARTAAHLDARGWPGIVLD